MSDSELSSVVDQKLYEEVTKLYGEGRYYECIHVCNEILTDDPHNATILNLIALCFYQVKREEEAIELAHQAIDEDPGFANGYYTLANAQYVLKHYDEALENYAKCIQLDPKHRYAYTGLANVIFLKQNWKRAIDVYTQAIEIDPHYPVSYCVRGLAHQKLGNTKEAINDLKKAKELLEEDEAQDLPENIYNYAKTIINSLVELESNFEDAEKKIDEVEYPEKDYIMKKLKDLEGEKAKMNINIASPNDEVKAQLADLQQKLNDLLGENEKLSKKVEKIDNAATNAQVYEQAKLREGFEKLKFKPACRDYARVFYWNTLNYFTAYRNLATGLIEGSPEELSTVQKVGKLAKNVALGAVEEIPLVGGLFKLLDSGIGAIYGAYQDQKQQNKINKVNEIITHNKDTVFDTDLSLRCASAALILANKKEDELENYDPMDDEEDDEEKHKGFKGMVEKVKQKLNRIKSKILKVEKVYENHATAMAIEDVIKLIASLFKYHDRIIMSRKQLDEQFVALVNQRFEVDIDADELHRLHSYNDEHDKLTQPGSKHNVLSDEKLEKKKRKFCKKCAKCSIF